MSRLITSHHTSPQSTRMKTSALQFSVTFIVLRYRLQQMTVLHFIKKLNPRNTWFSLTQGKPRDHNIISIFEMIHPEELI